MKSLLDKSEENYASFKILKDAGKYSSCVHCAYYSAFQLSIHSLTTKFGIPISYLIDHKKDSHKIVITEMCNIMEKELKINSLPYRTVMTELKKERGIADYSLSEHGCKHAGKIELKLNEALCIIKSNCL